MPSRCQWLKVRGVHARRVLALVVKVPTLRNVSSGALVVDPVGLAHVAVDPEMAVATLLKASLPYPTSRCLVYHVGGASPGVAMPYGEPRGEPGNPALLKIGAGRDCRRKAAATLAATVTPRDCGVDLITPDPKSGVLLGIVIAGCSLLALPTPREQSVGARLVPIEWTVGTAPRTGLSSARSSRAALHSCVC